jgi:hypothetical protein
MRRFAYFFVCLSTWPLRRPRAAAGVCQLSPVTLIRSRMNPLAWQSRLAFRRHMYKVYQANTLRGDKFSDVGIRQDSQLRLPGLL